MTIRSGVLLVLTFVCAIALVFLPPRDVDVASTSSIKMIQVVGKTDDGKYDIYDLYGDLDDLNYRTSDSYVFPPDALPSQLRFLTSQDANTVKYRCIFICKDINGRVVGLNPAWAKVYDVQLSPDPELKRMRKEIKVQSK